MDAGNYTILARLGEGPLGAIYEGAHKQTQERVVVRVLPAALAKEQNVLGRLLALQRALSRLEPERSTIMALRPSPSPGTGDPSIAGLIECGRLPEGGLYLVSEFVTGESLATQLRRHSGLPLPNKALRLGRQLSASLAVAHASNIHHQALRPEKILLVQVPGSADTEHLKILDLGLLTALGRVPRADELPANALPYLAPEFRRGEGPVAGQADVYALGVMLYEIGSGGLPASARSGVALTGNSTSGSLSGGSDIQTGLMQMLPSWLQPFAELLDRMLAPTPGERPSMAQVAGALQQLHALAPSPSGNSLQPPASASSLPPPPAPVQAAPVLHEPPTPAPVEPPPPAAPVEPPLPSPEPPTLVPITGASFSGHDTEEVPALAMPSGSPSSAVTPVTAVSGPHRLPPPPERSSAATPKNAPSLELSTPLRESAVTPKFTSEPPAPSAATPKINPEPPRPSAATPKINPEPPRPSEATPKINPEPPKPSEATPKLSQEPPRPSVASPKPVPEPPRPSAASPPKPAPEPPKAAQPPKPAPPPPAPVIEESDSVIEIPMTEDATLSSEPTRMSAPSAPAGRANSGPSSRHQPSNSDELEIQAEYTLNPKRPADSGLPFAPTHPSTAAQGTGGGHTAATPVEPGLGGTAVLRVGQLVGNFRIVSKIGQGGMGAVYASVHRQIGRRAAVKVLHGPLAKTSDYAARFLNEARAVNILRHPNLVEIFDFGQLPDGTLYIIMEFLEGESLRAKLRRTHKLPEPTAIELALQMARALEAAHQKGIVHRDLKPENVMLIADPVHPQDERIKILDFGIAKVGGQQQQQVPTDPDSQDFQTAVGTTMGTPKYMAPEQYGDASKVDGKADVFALGVMLYEMVSGQVPFPKTSLSAFHQAPKQVSAVAPTVSPKLAALIHRMLTPKSSERPSMREVLNELTPPPTPTPVMTAPTQAVPPPPPPLPSGGYWGWITLAFFVVAAALTGTAAYKGWLHPPTENLPTEPVADQADLTIDTAGPKARALGVLYQGLRAPDPKLRAQAAQALGQSRDVAQWSSIAALLKDRDPTVQATAAEALGQLGASDAHAELLSMLDSNPPPGVKVAVAGALARLVHPRGPAALREMLTDANERIRLRAALLLLESGDTTAAQPLRDAAAKGNLPEETVVLILGRLAQTGDAAAQQQLSARMAGEGFSQRRISAAGQLARLGDERARAFLLQGMQRPGPQQLISALLLATVGDNAGYGLFKSTAIDAKQPIEARHLAMDGLGACGRRQGAVLLAGVLDETTTRPALRQEAAGAILKISGGDPTQIARQSLSWAQAALGNDDWLVRQSATAVLADLDSDQAVPLLARALEDEQREVRRSAATALGQKTVRSALYALRTTLSDAEPEVRQAGLRAMANLLGTLGAVGSRVTDDQTKARLQQLVEGGSPEEQVVASATLLRLGDEAQRERLQSVLAAPDPILRKLLVETIPSDEGLLKQAVADSEQSVRFMAARRLAALGKPEAAPALREAVTSGGVDGLIAYSLLKKLGEQVAMPTGLAGLLGRDAATSLAVLDIVSGMPASEALPLLNTAHFDPSPQVRRKVGEVAAGLYRKEPDQMLLSVLYSLLNDTDVGVRTRVAALLGNLMRPNAQPKEEPPPDMSPPPVDMASPVDAEAPVAAATGKGSVRIVGEQWVRYQLDQQSSQPLSGAAVVLSVEPGRHTVSYAGGSVEVNVTPGATAVAQIPLTYADQLLGDAAEAIAHRDTARGQKILEKARTLIAQGRGPRHSLGDVVVLQARIYELQGRAVEAMTTAQTVFKMPESQKRPQDTAAAQAISNRLRGRLARLRISQISDGRCLLIEEWVSPGTHLIDQGGGVAKAVHVREGGDYEFNLCQRGSQP